jgi:hypothetical protein
MTVEFLVLIFTHYFADYCLQPEFLAITKGISWYNLLVHCIIYTGAITIAFYILGYTDLYFIISVVLISHIIIDKAKCIICAKNKDLHDKGYGAYNGDILYVDQFLHILILYILFVWC